MHPIFALRDGTIRIKPIGHVRSPVKEQQTGGLADARAQVVIEPELSPLLEGIDDFRHVWVLFWMSEIREHSIARRPRDAMTCPSAACSRIVNPIAPTRSG